MTNNHIHAQSNAPNSKLDKLKYEVATETLGRNMNQKIDSTNYESSLDQKKWESAEELGLKNKIEKNGWEDMTTEEVGRIGGKTGGQIGGHMVKKMIEMAEAQMAPIDETVIKTSRQALENND